MGLTETLDQWRERSQIGTACKCGAHSSAAWGEGGQDWLVDHVANAHPQAFDWKQAIKDALDVAQADPKAALEQLRALVDGEEKAPDA